MKKKITEVALERFMQYGIRSMTIKKLVEPLGISTKTVYKHFKNKEELLSECLNMMYGIFYNEFNALLKSNENPVVILLTLFRGTFGKDFGAARAFFYDLNHYYPELQNAAIGDGRDIFINMMTPVVERGIAERYFIDQMYPAITLNGIEILYTSITRSDRYAQFDVSPAVLFHNLVEIFLRGMCTESGIKQIEKLKTIV
ncbi:MAG: TetR/AcrR family transcriptional regulator [Mucilaginibacter sp.]